MGTQSRGLAVVTGASSGIGLALAKRCAEYGYSLLLASDEPEIQAVSATLRQRGTVIEALEADLASPQGVDALVDAVHGRPVEALLANAGRGLGHAFLDQSFVDVKRVIDTNVTGTLYLIHQLGRRMRERKQGRILITGSIAGFMPGTYQAVYNGTKALLDSFSYALRAELIDSGVTVTCLMPGATETEFFERADMLDTKVGAGPKQDPEEVAKAGFEAMLRGDSDVVTGWQNKLRAAIANVTPATVLAEQHRAMAAPGSAKERS